MDRIADPRAGAVALEMPRAGPLLPLSREHHTTLVLARNMQRAAREGTPDEQQHWLAQAQAHAAELLEPHFRQEETLLACCRSQLPQGLIDRLLAEHAQLRHLAMHRSTDPAADLHAFAELAMAHVRWEERTLFPLLQPLLENAEEQDPAS